MWQYAGPGPLRSKYMKSEYVHEYLYITVSKYPIVRAYVRCEAATRKVWLYRVVLLGGVGLVVLLTTVIAVIFISAYCPCG